MASGVSVPDRGRLSIPAATRVRPDRWFFSGMAMLATLAVFTGFAPSYFLKAAYGTPPLSSLLHVHGAVFTAWMLLLVTQTTLVAAGRTDVHRRLGMGGAALAAVMTVLALMVSIDGGRRGVAASGAAALSFLAIPLGTVVVFPTLVGAAIALRRKTDMHKRLMLLATTELVTAGVGRLSFLAAAGPMGFFVVSDLFIVALWVYDYATRGRIHSASLWGGLFLIGSQVLRVVGSGTEAWLSFARWITG